MRTYSLPTANYKRQAAENNNAVGSCKTEDTSRSKEELTSRN